MKKLTGHQIRSMWFSFFEEKGHDIIQSASLIPNDDPTLLWINAGIAPLKKFFDGRETPNNPRMCNAQKSLRTNDIDNVGLTARHHTFFEMLGNFSVGDYFRDEALTWACELLFSDKWFGFEFNDIYITYYSNDVDTYKKWIDLGISPEHLISMESNFWEIGEGPCGPDTEIFFDRGIKYDPKGIGTRLIAEDIENDRYIEIWNIVFSQFNAKNGVSRKNYQELPSRNIDTGCGLERLACVMQETKTNYETDLFKPYIDFISDYAAVKYDGQIAFKVIADHIRSVTFALADGASFSNEGRGYVLRRILRRAMRYGRKLNISEPFLYKMVNIVVDIMGDYYQYLFNKQTVLENIIKTEEENFLKTLENGEKKLLEIIDSSLDNKVSGKNAFLLYDTFGFPLELTIEACEERGYEVDAENFYQHLEQQKQRARANRSTYQSMNNQNADYMAFTKPSAFVGFNVLEISSPIVAIFKNGNMIDRGNSELIIVTNETPFYAESGGQISDRGIIFINDEKYEVENVFKLPNGQHAHSINTNNTVIEVNTITILKVDQNHRQCIMRNHSATHLVNAALRSILGDHVIQQGSLVTDTRLRFDFNHYKNLTLEEIIQIEQLVKVEIKKETEVKIIETSLEHAKKQGAQAVFGEKYGEVVRLVSVGFSTELCGGTHVNKTEDIGKFIILKIESKGSGIYRLEASTGDNAQEQLIKETAHLSEIINLNVVKTSQLCKTANTDGLIMQLPPFEKYVYQESYQDIINLRTICEETSILLKKCEKQYDDLIKTSATQNYKIYLDKAILNSDCYYLIEEIEYLDTNSAKELVDKISASYKRSLVIIFNCEPEKVTIIAKTVGTNYHCGDIVKKLAQITGGNGGGRKDFAQAGGRDPNLVPVAIVEIKKELGLI